jgi:hypothetical protein
MAAAITFVLTNLAAFLFAAALIIAALYGRNPNTAERYLSWLLLLSVGVETLWAGSFHVFFAQKAASSIGWQVSPFQFEIGVADLAIGAVAIASFWRSLSFKSAVVAYIVLFYAGVAIGHVRQAVQAGDYAPDNFGLLLLLTIVKVPLLIGLLWAAWRKRLPRR